MIACLYEPFKHWSAKGSVYIFSDPHFNDPDTHIMNPVWIDAESQIWLLNSRVHKNDTLVLLGDIGDPECAKRLKGHKVLISGNHDSLSKYRDIFDEIYDGPLMIAPKILLSHEAVIGLPWCINIHGHHHNGRTIWEDELGGKHINLAADVCHYVPMSLGESIKNGLISGIPDIHRITIDRATENSMRRSNNV